MRNRQRLQGEFASPLISKEAVTNPPSSTMGKVLLTPGIIETKGIAGLVSESWLSLFSNIGQATLTLLKTIAGGMAAGAMVVGSLFDLGVTYFNKKLRQRKTRYVTSLITLGVAGGVVLPAMVGLITFPPLVVPLVFLGLVNMGAARESYHLYKLQQEIEEDNAALEDCSNQLRMLSQSPRTTETETSNQRRLTDCAKLRNKYVTLAKKIAVNKIKARHLTDRRDLSLASNIAIGFLIASVLIAPLFPPLAPACAAVGLSLFLVCNLAKWASTLSEKREIKKELTRQQGYELQVEKQKVDSAQQLAPVVCLSNSRIAQALSSQPGSPVSSPRETSYIPLSDGSNKSSPSSHHSGISLQEAGLGLADNQDEPESEDNLTSSDVSSPRL